MDFDYVRQNGYASWQVIPTFFATYIGMVLVFGACGQVAWVSYLNQYMPNRPQEARHFMWNISWIVLITGSCLISVAFFYGIVACLIIPVIRKRRQRARHAVHIPEPESVSVEGEIKTWFASSPSDVQEVQESYSLHALPHR